MVAAKFQQIDPHCCSLQQVKMTSKSDTATIKVFHPRDDPGGTAQWQADVSDVMRLSGIPGWVLDGPPSLEQIEKQQPTYDKAEAKLVLSQSMLEYQAYNTQLWVGRDSRHSIHCRAMGGD
jgi:hypothetical protein